MRKHNINEINLEITDMAPFDNEKYKGFIIQWDSDIGFGEYTIYQDKESNNSKWMAHSECMDSSDDKEFIEELMELFIEKLTIVG